MHFFYIFLQKYLFMSKKSSTFVPDLKSKSFAEVHKCLLNILAIMYNSQM